MRRDWYRVLYNLRDVVFPSLEPLTPEQEADDRDRRQKEQKAIVERVSVLPSNEEILKERLEDTAKLLEQEKSRQQGIESKLAGIIGLSSLAATVLFSGLVARATSPTHAPDFAKLLLTIGALYLILQLFCALRAAVAGISRAHYSTHTAEDILPPRGVARTVAMRQRIALNLNMLDGHRDENNRKVDRMAVAHRAMSNLLWGLIFVAIVAAYIAVTPEQAASPSSATNAQPVANSTSRQEFVLMRVATIGPFPSGKHELDAEATTACLERAIQVFGPTAPFGWQLVGGVDKLGLRADRAAIYGTNQALAMARAAWVRDNVLGRVESAAASEAMVVVAGASNVGLRVDDSRLTADRTVQVYAFVNKATAARRRSTASCH
ncbi:hypothetical protein [Burkholderia ubonensis]|uniref:hypothetical protein n=1 Tax=Burkholderia ubonensis TaxID=101571 RepID=UPI000AFF8934|nr:hypothetical protein [Burkholderia ubonensis]